MSYELPEKFVHIFATCADIHTTGPGPLDEHRNLPPGVTADTSWDGTQTITLSSYKKHLNFRSGEAEEFGQAIRAFADAYSTEGPIKGQNAIGWGETLFIRGVNEEGVQYIRRLIGTEPENPGDLSGGPQGGPTTDRSR